MKAKRTIQLSFFSILLVAFFVSAGSIGIANADSDFIIISDDAGHIYYAKSVGDGTWTDYQLITTLSGYMRGAAIADYDNDGDLDFIVGSPSGDTMNFYLFTNDGAESFTSSTVGTGPYAASYQMDMTAGDFNKDGKMDFLGNTNHGSGYSHLGLGDGAGGFTISTLTLGGGYGRGIDIADFDHDSDLDFARAIYSNGYIYIHPGNGDGTFGTPIYVGDSGDDPYGVVAGDFNNDGHPDIIANSGSGGDPYLFAGNGDGTFETGVYIGSLDFGNHGAYDAYDFNCDGNLDIVASSYTSRKVYYYSGKGDGTFNAVVQLGTTSSNCLGISAPPLIELPRAILSTPSQTIDKEDSIDFDGSSSYAATGHVLASWLWDFGDGNSSPDVGTTTHQYLTEGVFTVDLRVTDEDCMSSHDKIEIIVEGDDPTVITTPVVFNETYADDGFWNLTLDGVDYSSDTEGIVYYEWILDDNFEEGFEDGNADGWYVFDGTWLINDSDAIDGSYSYHQTDNSMERTRTWTLFDKVYDTDITIEADVQIVDTTSNEDEIQIIFRAKDERNNYEFILRGDGSNDVLLYRRINGSASQLVRYVIPYDITTGVTYHVKIVCTGSLIEFYLDDVFLFSHTDSTFSSGMVGFSTYRTEALFDNLEVTATATGQYVDHAFEAGTYNVELTVTDAAGQSDTGVIPMTMQPGAVPTADANGPYNVNESIALAGGWNFSLDSTGSADDVEVRTYVWDLGTDNFDGNDFNEYKWYANGVISQDGAVSLSGSVNNSWNSNYMVTKATFPVEKGQVFQAKFSISGNYYYWFGFKNASTTDFHRDRFQYAFYIYSGNIRIYENGTYVLDTGYDISYGVAYDFKIELTDDGAIYSYKPSGTNFWYEVYRSSFVTTETSLRKGMGIYSSDRTITMDDFVETTAGANPSVTIYRTNDSLPQTYNVDLTVCDRAGQCDRDSTTGEIDGNDPPVADAGPDQTKGEADISEGIWSYDFDASGSSDVDGIYTYEWDWAYDDNAGFNPSGDTAVTASHSWDTSGVYTVAVRITDHALQSTIDTVTVTADQGTPPVADTGGPYTVNEVDAFEGGWTVTLNGFVSSDDTNIEKYIWDIGTDTFDGTVINEGKWVHNGYVTQNGEISISHPDSGWGERYFFSKDTYSRAPGMAFEAKIKLVSYYTMVGLKNTNTNGHYNQYPYAFYFYYGNIRIYEDGSYRTDTGFDIAYDTWYDIRIELKPTQGARYYYRQTGDPDWILVYDSNYGNATEFKRGFDVGRGTFYMDDIKEIAAGMAPSYRFYGLGSHTVNLTVYDNAGQSDTDSSSVTTVGDDPPVADAVADQTGDESDSFGGTWYLSFNGSGTDDYGIYKYEWDWDYDGTFDPSGDTGTSVTHPFVGAGTYTIAFRVTDHALQTDIETATVTLSAGIPPTADAGGPYDAGEGGPPAYFNGSSSSDDYGVVKYLWDVDAAVDSNGDGNFMNDIDVVGRKPFFTYSTIGNYTVTLTVEDGAGQANTATTTVNVATNLAPDVICVPWVAGNPIAPHNTYDGRSIRLKAIVRDAGSLEYRWDFGDGTSYPADGVSYAAVTNKYAIETIHTYSGDNGTPFTATLFVRDSAGLEGTDNYYVIIRPDDLDTNTNIAIDEGLWYNHKTQDRDGTDYGKWSSYSSYYSSSTASAIQAFEINGHVQDGDNQENPYVETVTRGFEYLFTQLQSQSISIQTYGNPDTNGNGIGIETNNNREIYEGGMVMDAIASSNTPRAFVYTGGVNIKGRFYYEILNDMVDMYAWGQVDSGSYRGGWRYDWNSEADNSACQWAAIGLLAAEDTFGIEVPQWVKDQNNDWLDFSYNGTGFGYTSASDGVATTPSGMVQLAFGDKTTSDPRWITAENRIANSWFWQHNNYYAIYALVKAMRLAQPSAVEVFSATGLDWYNHPTNGVRYRLVIQQVKSGGDWGSWDSAGYGNRGLDTSWAIIMLTPTLFVQPPVADAGDDIIWAFDEPLSFNASGSFHMDPARSIVQYEWDYDGDGTWDFTTTNPSDPAAVHTYPDPDPLTDGDPPEVYIVRLRVTDDNDPAQTDIDTREVTVAEPPHAPYADAGGPYTVTAGIPFTLDGGGSSDIDPGDSISRYKWDLDHDGVFFGDPLDPDDDLDVDTDQPTTTWTYDTPGVYNIGLIVEDNGAYNPVGCTIGVDCDPMESLPDFTTVKVVENLPPLADAGGPYAVDEGAPASLDGSASYDPNGDVITYAWDLDNDGDFDDSTDPNPTWTWMDDGTYTVGLKVSDSLLEDTATVDVTVNDLGPTAAFIWAPEPQVEGSAVNFIDTSTSFPDTIDGWDWDFGGVDTSSEQNPSFTFNNQGIYTVMLTVTDEDGSTDMISHDVTITDKAPSASLSGDTVLNEGQTGNYDAGGSTSSPDAIAGYEWDWNYDGTTFNPSGDTGATQSHTWDDDGSYTVAVRVTDDDGSTDIATFSVTVNDLGPTAILTGDTPIDEGSPGGTYDAGGSIPGIDLIVSYEWDWDYDGITYNFSAPTTDAVQTHYWNSNGVYTVAVRVTDDDGSTDIATLEVTVNDLGPTAYLTGPVTLDEGQQGAFDSTGSSSDPDGLLAAREWDWDYDSGSWIPGPPATNHTYDDDGLYTVAVRVTDDDGSTDIATLSVTVNDLGPTASLSGDTVLDEGQSGSYDASGSTSSPDAIANYEWDWDYDGSTFTPSGDTGANPTHAWSSFGNYTVAVRVTDEDGSADIATLQVTVSPSGTLTASLTGDTLIGEGQSGSYDASASTGPYPITGYEWDWDYDGSFDPSGDTGITQTHAWLDNDIYDVAVRVTDDHSNTDIAVLSVEVTDLGPTALLSGDTTLDENQVGDYNASGSISDPDTIVGYEWDWNYDGSTFTPSGDTGPVQTHAWATAGTHTVAVRVTDDDGSTDIATLDVTVEGGAPICGDLDHDGDVDINDMYILRNALLSRTGDVRFVPEADYDGDGSITYNDYRLWYTCYRNYLNP